MLTSSYAAVEQAGNGVTLAFDFGFKILAASDLQVYKLDAAGAQSSLLILGTDYTVSFDPIAENGTVTYTTAPVSGGYSLIERSTEQTQETSLPREGPMPAKTVETMIDKLTAIVQELQAGSSESPVELSGLFADRPAAPTINCYYYSTDRGSYEKWVVTAQRWFLLG